MQVDPFEFGPARSYQPMQKGDLISNQHEVQVYFEGDELRIVWNDEKTASGLEAHHFTEENIFSFSPGGQKTTLFGP